MNLPLYFKESKTRMIPNSAIRALGDSYSLNICKPPLIKKIKLINRNNNVKPGAITTVATIIRNKCNNLNKITKTLKTLFKNIQYEKGENFVHKAYSELVAHMNLKEVAPEKITITKIKNDECFRVVGGYNPFFNKITYSNGFLNHLNKAKQINLISHELKHCEQINKILRTEDLGLSAYAKFCADNSINKLINNSSNCTDLHFLFRYKEALKNGLGEEFLINSREVCYREYLRKLSENYKNIKNLPIIKADSIDGIAAKQYFEALKEYEGLSIFGTGNEKYKNSILEKEAYQFGNKMEYYFKKFDHSK